jgi:exonuclease VII small subunit
VHHGAQLVKQLRLRLNLARQQLTHSILQQQQRQQKRLVLNLGQ